MLAIEHIKPAIHEAETIGGTHHRITGEPQDGTVLNLHEFEVAAETLPRGDQLRLDC